ncbi:MAG: hypothetical protein COW11_06410 [Candidatus Omnitrophica bacterium CG12_big_fil_rev_8_21_14_0_65_43_15]|uniref:DUF4015 domain-containing protein n=1 Tax=Candidatus Taenaricola geysiri TaxID=1974752 RepID=A0A2J0LDC6_9BACT|nr:MAG: hypothetical protein AUJ89_02925 [Candidatus Omnitrophica bacterium CG1_02_43_210]PIV12034.1 MAG: hypothetical protein COS48_02905 [Candidatus Omnitrophica bacterium CG03_land_8_20_14_0_80_43_22]PIW65861.1 MAG: hypothetical protein COW11_06410 [Candidatus Omnitrophica bacterium CG12_big_fil_rev_8_21_14_0_65_43_15]PIW80104.1 MAG: hypothetical protein COZ98_04010 [Candidatus Omnitrophica bacterium CG_4_8_14_3_um_filter_43_15]PIY84368.1 MAG: hypothetical protein COY77_02790 [Candidatus Omn
MKLGVSYFGSRMPDDVADDMKAIRDNRCNFVVHTFSEEDMEFYPGTMEKIVKASKKEGLEVWIDPWAVGQTWGGESYSNFIAKNVDAMQKNAEGGLLPAACLNNPKYRKFMTEWTDAAIKIGADNIFWDEPHFYLYPEAEGCKGWACRCDICCDLFKKRFSKDMPVVMDDNVRLFKEDCLVDFLKFLCDYAKTKKKDIVNSMCYLPFENTSTFTDWSKVAKIASLDIIGTDPYWRKGQTEQEIVKRVGGQAERIAKLAKEYNKEGQIWILNFNIAKGREKDIELAIETTHKAGIRNIAAWSYYGTYQMSNLSSDDPKAVWQTLGRMYKKLH